MAQKGLFIGACTSSQPELLKVLRESRTSLPNLLYLLCTSCQISHYISPSSFFPARLILKKQNEEKSRIPAGIWLFVDIHSVLYFLCFFFPVRKGRFFCSDLSLFTNVYTYGSHFMIKNVFLQ